MGSTATQMAVLLLVLACVFLVVRVNSSHLPTPKMPAEEKTRLREKTIEMFYHAYNSYMDNAFPADELMPLSCKGRYRGSEPSRGDIDDSLGNFTLTLIDTLDTLAVFGDVEAFEDGVRKVIKNTRFDTDIIVSVFETNIRILGGLLGGHVAASYFKRRKLRMQWYQDELLTMAKEVGDRLLPAFNTSTGIPYPRINMKHGITPALASTVRDTCTSCAGTMLLEFAALSRLTGHSVYEEKARKAMDYLWAQRHRTNNLMGNVLNIHNGDWVRRESGVGAGIDSYYEYVLKGYVLLGDNTLLARFNKHYDAVMRYVSQGPLLVDVHMHRPTSVAKNFMDSLLAFWPGLQVLVGDIGPAVETHEMLYQVVQRHNFLPEAFTTDFRVHWAHHPLRPEFLESTYFLYKATADPYYLEVGKKVLENLEEHARVDCGFAAIKDLKKLTLEDQMDSFVLAETFKYLYLLFSDKEDVILNIDDFIFTTEAHLLPLTLSVGNYSWRMPEKVRPDIYKFDMMSVAEMTKAAEDDINLTEEEFDEDWGMCRNYHVTVPEGPGYPHRLRSQLQNLVHRPAVRHDVPVLRAADFVAGNKEHLDLLNSMGIRIETMADGRIQLLHTATEAASQPFAEAGLRFMQEMIELSKQQKQETHHEPMYVRVVSPPFNGGHVLRAGPAQFGYDLIKEPPIQGQLAIATPLKACTPIENPSEVQGKIAFTERGDCMFIDKARQLERAGAIGGIVLDQSEGSSSDKLSMFAMSGDGKLDVKIPMVFLFHRQGQDLLGLFKQDSQLVVELTSVEAPVQSADSDAASRTPPTPHPHSTSNLSSEKEADSTSHPAPPASTIPHSTSDPSSTAPLKPPPMLRDLAEENHSFYHHEVLDASNKQYYLQAGTKYFYLLVVVTRREEGDSDSASRQVTYELLPDGAKAFTFYLRYNFVGEERIEKPNLNEMYLDVVHGLQHNTNFEHLPQSSNYMRAIARFMESAFFNMDRIDREALELMQDFTNQIKFRHTYPDGKTKNVEANPDIVSPHMSTSNNLGEGQTSCVSDTEKTVEGEPSHSPVVDDVTSQQQQTAQQQQQGQATQQQQQQQEEARKENENEFHPQQPEVEKQQQQPSTDQSFSSEQLPQQQRQHQQQSDGRSLGDNPAQEGEHSRHHPDFSQRQSDSSSRHETHIESTNLGQSASEDGLPRVGSTQSETDSTKDSSSGDQEEGQQNSEGSLKHDEF